MRQLNTSTWFQMIQYIYINDRTTEISHMTESEIKELYYKLKKSQEEPECEKPGKPGKPEKPGVP